MRKLTIQILGGAAAACVAFLCCVLIIGQFYHLCMPKKFAYATLIGMPLGSFAGIYLIDRFFYATREFTVIGVLAGLAFTMILLLVGIYLVALVPATFFVFPILISTCCLLGHKLGFNIQLRKQVPAQRGSN